MTVMISPWMLLALALPVLLLGEVLHRRVGWIARFNIPVAVAGGFAVALLVLGLRLAGGPVISFNTMVSAGWWTWLVTPEVDWISRPAKSVTLPLLVGFFTCIGLNATWQVLKDGSRALLVLVSLATLFAVVQNVVGIGLAMSMDASPLLGIICGALTLTGGHGTALGFAPAFVSAGFPAAASVAAASATFGLVAASMVAAPAATWLIRRHSLATQRPPGEAVDKESRERKAPGFIGQLRALFALGSTALIHLGLLLACVKAGSWVSYLLNRADILFPVYMGALLVGLGIRNASDRAFPGLIRSDVIVRLASILLGLFLAVTLTSLNLAELVSVAGPMLAILCVQVGLMIAFALWITWPALGRNYEAAVMTAGHIGFGLGNTATAVASMDALVARYGPAPRAFTVVPPTGGFLIDLTNAVVITVFLNVAVAM